MKELLLLIGFTVAAVLIGVLASVFGPGIAWLIFAAICGGIVLNWSLPNENLPRNPDI